MDNKQQTESTDSTTHSPTPLPAPVIPAQRKRLSTKAIVAIVLGSIVFLLVISGLIVWSVLARQSKNPNTATNYPADSSQNSSYPSSNLNMGDLVTVNQRARDSERKTDINSLRNQLEASFAKNGGYPTLRDVNDKNWRLANDFNVGDNDKALADPLTPNNTVLSARVPTTATGSYTYKPTPVGCMGASDAKGELINPTNFCTSYTLTALLENKNDKAKDPSSTSVQTFYIKTSVND